MFTELIDIRTYTTDRTVVKTCEMPCINIAIEVLIHGISVRIHMSLYQFLAQSALQHAGIEDRHLAAHYGKCQVVSIASATITCQRTDAIRMRQSTRLGMYLAPCLWSRHLMSQRTINACNRQVLHEHGMNTLILIAIHENCRQCLRRKMIVGTQATPIVYNQ